MRRKPEFYSLVISFPAGAVDGVQIGASVAVNGTCLTVWVRGPGDSGSSARLACTVFIGITRRSMSTAIARNATGNCISICLGGFETEGGNCG